MLGNTILEFNCHKIFEYHKEFEKDSNKETNYGQPRSNISFIFIYKLILKYVLK